MKYLLLIFLAFACKNSKPANELRGKSQKIQRIKKTDLIKERLNGKVKAVVEYTYGTRNKADKNGEIQKGQPYDTIVSKFDEKGNRLESTQNKSYSLSIVRTKYIYNNKGYLIESIGYLSDNSLGYKQTLKYDSSGNPIEEKYQGTHPDIKRTRIFKYDDAGNKIEEFTDTIGGCIWYKMAYKYDANGNMIEWRTYYCKDTFVDKATFIYDNENRLIEMDGYNRKSLVETRQIRKHSHYDKYKNPLREDVLINGKATSITQREIEYY